MNGRVRSYSSARMYLHLKAFLRWFTISSTTENVLDMYEEFSRRDTGWKGRRGGEGKRDLQESCVITQAGSGHPMSVVSSDQRPATLSLNQEQGGCRQRRSSGPEAEHHLTETPSPLGPGHQGINMALGRQTC